jgi:hypothetical protein
MVLWLFPTEWSFEVMSQPVELTHGFENTYGLAGDIVIEIRMDALRLAIDFTHKQQVTMFPSDVLRVARQFADFLFTGSLETPSVEPDAQDTLPF